MTLYMNRFQIRDLEAFSGVKAHTIRMWEKRYGLLAPDRRDSNIRTYGPEELKAILNVAYLNQRGYKISRIAAMNAAERERLVTETAGAIGSGEEALNSLKLAMLSFDEVLFESVSAKFREQHGFRALVERIYVPLLEQIGLLWQSNAICPAQEHFVSNLIRHRLVITAGALPLSGSQRARTFVLYLPENEIHELGLLYLNYLLRAKGEKVVYLGQSVPTADLLQVASLLTGDLVMVSVLMATPSADEVPAYLKALRAMIPDERVSHWIAGAQLVRAGISEAPPGVRLHGSMVELVASVDALA